MATFDKISPLRQFAFALASLLLFTVPASAQSLHFLTNAVVDSEGVFLSQLVLPDAASALPQLRIAEAPQFGQAALVTQAQILEVLRKSSPETFFTNLAGPDKIRITRRARPFNESEIKEQLTALLQKDFVKDKGELELRFVRPWISGLLPDEPLNLKILDLPAAGISPACIIRFELSTRREILGSWQAPVTARVWREVWVAKSQLRRDQLLSDAEVSRERRDVLLIHEPLLPVQPGPSLEIAESISAGSPIYLRSVRPHPVVFRGQMVEAQLLDGTMSISLKVEVMENGAPGQIVRLRNPQSHRQIRGKVQNEQTVLITL